MVRFIGRRKGAVRKVFDIYVELQSKQGQTSFTLTLSV